MNDIHHIITKVLANSASNEEKSLLDDWLREKPENKQDFELRRQQWEEMLLIVDDKDKKRVFTDIKNKINQETKVVDFNKHVDRKKSIRWMKVAASVVSFISLGALSYYEITYPFSHLNLIGYNLVETEAGVQQTQLLADGSTVYLNGDSRLKYKIDSEANERTLYLEGEAFFDVARDESKPFVIGLEDSHVQVLGTSFNIKAYSEDEQISTSVISGRVAFEASKSLILIPGNKGIIDKAKNTMAKLDVDNAMDVAWMKKALYFENTSLSEMAKSLYRMYGVKLKFLDGSLKDLKITAKFENERLDELFKILEMTNEFSYKIEDDVILIGGVGKFK
ncbi:FecR family protein [Ancylomarina subtilis]|uniref:FecR family protein n=1 Tax=Ancylomarina subtilis TaxID=1639035 RepID=A0A4Q7VJ51_9BACT|nr:FecR domain-containing protein [Ancylomarina subtilis]RZT96210.1 FecR family protein [Ancylomarina subtilis]